MIANPNVRCPGAASRCSEAASPSMIARTLARRVRGGPHAPALARHMSQGMPRFPPPMGKHDDPLEPNLVLEESATGLDAGLPMVRDRDVWADPEALLPERHELWWDDGTAEPEWYIDRTFPAPRSVPQMSAELGGMLAFLIFGVGGFAMLLGDNNHKRAASRAAAWSK